MTQQLGFFGLGIMGASMAGHLARAGFPVRIWNRSAGPSEALASEHDGIEVAGSIEELFESCDVVMSCLTKADIFLDYIPRLGSRDRRATVYADLSTSSPKISCDLGAQLRELGVTYFDCPVSGGDIGAKNGTLVTMCGGPAEEFQVLQPLLETFSAKVFLCGPVGAGQRMKCVNQVAVASAVVAMTESMKLAEAIDLPAELVLEVLSSGAADSWSLRNYAPRVLEGDLAPGFRAADMLKDLRFALEEASTGNLDLPATKLVTELYEKLSSLEGEYGNHALCKVY